MEAQPAGWVRDEGRLEPRTGGPQAVGAARQQGGKGGLREMEGGAEGSRETRGGGR